MEYNYEQHIDSIGEIAVKLELHFELEGTILVCTNDEGYDTSAITYGKQYVLDETYTDYQTTCVVIDNHNNRATLNRDRFVTLDQWRDKQLNKII